MKLLNFKKVKISQKIILFISSLFIFLCILGIATYISFNKLSTASQNIYQENLISVKEKLTLASELDKINVSTTSMLITQKVNKAQIQDIEKRKKQLDKQILLLKKSTDKSEVNNLIKFESLYESYSDELNNILEIIQQDRIEVSVKAKIASIRYERMLDVINETSAIVNHWVEKEQNLAKVSYENSLNLKHKIVFSEFSLMFLFFCIIGFVSLELWRSIGTPLKKIIDAMESMANGKINQKVIIHNEDEFKQLADSFNQMSDKLKNIMGKIKKASEFMSISSENLSSSSKVVTSETKIITSEIENIILESNNQEQKTRKSIEELKVIENSILSIAKTSLEVRDESNIMIQKSFEGENSIKNMSHQMNEINASVEQISLINELLNRRSEEIGRIIEVITNIAQQTNLLALNANIEAARAGIHGKSFQVVANEVKKLAVESAQSANQITDIIKQIQEDTDKAVETTKLGKKNTETGIKVVEYAGNTFNQIFETSNNVSKSIKEISESTKHITTNSGKIESAMGEIAYFTKESADKTTKVIDIVNNQNKSIAEYVEELNNTSKELQSLIEIFHL